MYFWLRQGSSDAGAVHVGFVATSEAEVNAFYAAAIAAGATDNGPPGARLYYDPRYYATYYTIDAVNFKPVASLTAMDTIDAAYLPLVVQDAAGIPLDPSFEEQKKIMLRCKGLFYSCKAGAEMRRFNRMLIDAGLIKGMVSR